MGCTLSQQCYDKEGVYTKSNGQSAKGHVKLIPPQNCGDETFTQQEKQILRETWKLVSTDRQEQGMAIFIEIFRKWPDLQMLFPFKNCSHDELLQQPMFRSHALRFINSIDTTIHSLDALDVALIPVLHQLGKTHVNINIDLPKYMHVFMHAIIV